MDRRLPGPVPPSIFPLPDRNREGRPGEKPRPHPRAPGPADLARFRRRSRMGGGRRHRPGDRRGRLRRRSKSSRRRTLISPCTTPPAAGRRRSRTSKSISRSRPQNPYRLGRCPGLNFAASPTQVVTRFEDMSHEVWARPLGYAALVRQAGPAVPRYLKPCHYACSATMPCSSGTRQRFVPQTTGRRAAASIFR